MPLFRRPPPGLRIYVLPPGQMPEELLKITCSISSPPETATHPEATSRQGRPDPGAGPAGGPRTKRSNFRAYRKSACCRAPRAAALMGLITHTGTPAWVTSLAWSARRRAGRARPAGKDLADQRTPSFSRAITEMFQVLEHSTVLTGN